ncbi:hypothetical protein NLG97_g9915 [Lecanicillium saksenae]|uniref:Uncharacterized protein n=1 Tax=Lecanicillium saksenae TaxID=468837 RepID=A0ACC1QEN1_9HYPO|nr:hypothetical protein NLG97_g9915 [Lecanicillium saksenae]
MHPLKLLATAAVASAAVPSGGPSHIPRDGGGRFKTLPAIPIAARQEHSTTRVTPSTLAIVGGIVLSDSAPGGFVTADLMQIYNISSGVWTRAADLPVALNHPNTAAVGGKIYLLGGLKGGDNSVWRATGDSWEYDPAARTWRTLPPMPKGYEAGSAAVGVHENLIVLAGGLRALHLDSEFQDTVDSVVMYDLHADAWRSVPVPAQKLPEGRDHAGSAVVDGTMYVVGGPVPRAAECWKEASAKMPTARGGLAAAAVGKTIYTFGGEGNPEAGSDGVFPQVEAYDITKNAWTRMRNMTTPRHGTYAASLKGGVYIPGGGIRQDGAPVDLFEVFYP